MGGKWESKRLSLPLLKRTHASLEQDADVLVLTTDEVVEKLLLTIRNTQPKHARDEREKMQDGKKKKKQMGWEGSNKL